MVVQLRHRAHGRARRADDAVLVDRNRGWYTLDRVNVRTIHSVQELTRVRAECLDVAALTFCVERVEDKRAFARAGKARYNREFADGNVDVDVA